MARGRVFDRAKLNLPMALAFAAAAGSAFVPVMRPRGASAVGALSRAAVGLAAVVLCALAESLEQVVLIVLAAGVAWVALDRRSTRPYPLREPAVAVAALSLALLFARVPGPPLLTRLAAVGLLGGIGVTAGVAPFIHRKDADEGYFDLRTAWIGFVGPVVVLSIVGFAPGLLGTEAGAAFAEMLLGIGLLNALWGTLAAWWTREDAAAWHYSFMADWGLAMCGLGLTVADGRAAGLVILSTVVFARFPAALAFQGIRSASDNAVRVSVRESAQGMTPVGALISAMLAGAAPFAGFVGRLLLLRGAAQLYWPLAVVLAAVLLLWLPSSLRLGRTLRGVSGRRAWGLLAVLVLNAAFGLLPLPLLVLGSR